MTVVVSLALVGASLMLRQGVQNATRRWQGGIEFVVFMKPERHARTRPTASAQDLAGQPRDPALHLRRPAGVLRGVQAAVPRPARADRQRRRPSDLPPSYRVVPVDKTEQAINELGKLYQSKPGVKEVVLRLGHHPGGAGAVAAADGRHHRGRPGAAGRGDPADPEHHPHGHVRPPTGDRGHEAGGGHQLVHPGAVHARGTGPGRRRAPCWRWLALASFKPFFQRWLPNPQDFPLVSGFVLSAAVSCSPSTRCMFVTGCVVGVDRRRRRRHPLPRRLTRPGRSRPPRHG